MSKAIGIAALGLAGWVADQHYNYGYYTDAVASLLRQMGHSFGW